MKKSVFVMITSIVVLVAVSPALAAGVVKFQNS